MIYYLIEFVSGELQIQRRTAAPIGANIVQFIKINDSLGQEDPSTFDILDVPDGEGGTFKQAIQDSGRKSASDAAKAQAIVDRQAAQDAKKAKIDELKALNPVSDLNNVPEMRDALIKVMEVLGLR